MSALPETIHEHWGIVSPILTIRSDADYDRAVERLNSLIDEIGDNENHPLYDLLDTLGVLLHAYEEQHDPMPSCDGGETLSYLMQEHHLSPSDLPELGSPEVVSDIMQGKRELHVRDLRCLAERFHVSPAAFC